MPSRSAASRARAGSRLAIATTSFFSEARIAGMTERSAMRAVPRMPQRSRSAIGRGPPEQERQQDDAEEDVDAHELLGQTVEGVEGGTGPGVDRKALDRAGQGCLEAAHVADHDDAGVHRDEQHHDDEAVADELE